MRRSEILGLSWENINLEKRIAFLSKTKNGSSRTVPLSLKAIDILKSLPCIPNKNIFLCLHIVIVLYGFRPI